MKTHLWPQLVRAAAVAAAWLNARDPAHLPHWVWAALLVAAAAVLGRVGARILAGLLQVALVAAALLIAWQMISAPGAVRAAAPAACTLEGTCGQMPNSAAPSQNAAAAGGTATGSGTSAL